MDINFAVGEDLVYCLDFDGFDSDVFKQDSTNVIEVT